MSLSPLQLETQIQELLDGILAEEKWPALREELRNSAQARELYCDHVRLTSQLKQRSRKLKSLKTPTPIIPHWNP